MYKYSDCISTCLLLSGPSAAPADAEPGWSVQEMKVHRMMIKFGIWGVQSSQGSAAALREAFCVDGPCLAADALGLFSCITSCAQPQAVLCCCSSALPGSHIHAWAGLTAQGMILFPNLCFSYVFWVQLASGFLSARWAAVLEASWAAQELWVSLLILLPVSFFFLPIKGNQ